jgi:hypothetical protein
VSATDWRRIALQSFIFGLANDPDDPFQTACKGGIHPQTRGFR